MVTLQIAEDNNYILMKSSILQEKKNLQFLNECVKLHALTLSMNVFFKRRHQKWKQKFRYASIGAILDLISFFLADMSYHWFPLIYYSF